MILSQEIARMLEEMLEEAGGELSIVRNEFALRMGCVPSQINYVISSRFTPERGYLVESRRGGGGYIRIRKLAMGKEEYLMHFYKALEGGLSEEGARYFATEFLQKGILTEREAKLIYAMLSDRALASLPRPLRDQVRAEEAKRAILEILSEMEE
jgi:transcriptional regulator CtsR